MVVLQINAVYKKGSTGKIAYGINNRLLNDGHDSYVAFGEGIATSDHEYRIGSWLDHKMHAVFWRITGRQAHFSRRATRRLLSWIQEINPDVIHLHNLHSNYIDVNLLLQGIRVQGIPVVITLHDCWFYTGGCFHYTRNNCYSWKQDCRLCQHQCYFLKPFSPNSAQRNLEELRTGILGIENICVTAVSEWIKREFEESTLSKAPSVLIKNGVDAVAFTPRNSDFRKRLMLTDEFVILGPASKWLAQYNKEAFEYLMSKIKRLKNVKIILFGCTETQMRTFKTKAYPNLILLGYLTDQKELTSLYSMSDVFVNLSWEDSFSLINVEAQMCGTPVISYEACGARETVNTEGLGKVVPNGHYEGIFCAIEQCMSERWKSFSNDVRTWVVERFNEKLSLDAYLELYESMCREKNK